MANLSIFRLIAFIGASVLAAAVLALASHTTFLTIQVTQYESSYQSSPYGQYYSYFDWVPLGSVAVAIGTAALTLLILPPFLIVGAVHTAPWTSMIIVEIVTLIALFSLWITSGSLFAIGLTNVVPCTADLNNFLFDGLTLCQENVAVSVLSYVAGILLLAYIVILLVFVLIACSRGHSVWTGNVKNTDFLAPRQPAQYPHNFVPVPQQQFGQQFGQYPQYNPQLMYPVYQDGTPVPQMPTSPMQQPMQQMPGSPMPQPMMQPMPAMPIEQQHSVLMTGNQPKGSPVASASTAPPPQGGEV